MRDKKRVNIRRTRGRRKRKNIFGKNNDGKDIKKMKREVEAEREEKKQRENFFSLSDRFF